MTVGSVCGCDGNGDSMRGNWIGRGSGAVTTGGGLTAGDGGGSTDATTAGGAGASWVREYHRIKASPPMAKPRTKPMMFAIQGRMPAESQTTVAMLLQSAKIPACASVTAHDSDGDCHGCLAGTGLFAGSRGTAAHSLGVDHRLHVGPGARQRSGKPGHPAEGAGERLPPLRPGEPKTLPCAGGLRARRSVVPDPRPRYRYTNRRAALPGLAQRRTGGGANGCRTRLARRSGELCHRLLVLLRRGADRGWHRG